MPEYVEQWNIVETQTTILDESGTITGYQLKQTIFPFNGIIIGLFLIGVFLIIKKATGR